MAAAAEGNSVHDESKSGKLRFGITDVTMKSIRQPEGVLGNITILSNLNTRQK